MNSYERLTWPFASRGAQNEAAREAEPEARREAERTPLRVLIVEDSADDALLLLRELKRGATLRSTSASTLRRRWRRP